MVLKRNWGGGAREGAGRPSLGEKKTVTITMPREQWETIEDLIMQGAVKNKSEAFRMIVYEWAKENGR
jgi:hypothetical protein